MKLSHRVLSISITIEVALLDSEVASGEAGEFPKFIASPSFCSLSPSFPLRLFHSQAFPPWKDIVENQQSADLQTSIAETSHLLIPNSPHSHRHRRIHSFTTCPPSRRPSRTRASTPTTNLRRTFPFSKLPLTSSTTICQRVLNTDTNTLVSQLSIARSSRHILDLPLTSLSSSNIALPQCNSYSSIHLLPSIAIIRRPVALPSSIDTQVSCLIPAFS